MLRLYSGSFFADSLDRTLFKQRVANDICYDNDYALVLAVIQHKRILERSRRMVSIKAK